MNRNEIQDLTLKLENLYPVEGSYGSRASLYSKALRDEVITQEQLNEAREFYGRLWNYVGD